MTSSLAVPDRYFKAVAAALREARFGGLWKRPVPDFKARRPA